MRLGAIILAGGRGTRMGRAKDSLPWRGRSLLECVAAELTTCCAPVVVVARDERQPLPPLPAAIARTADAVAERGPLAGLAAGLRWHGADQVVFATACDQPFVDAAFVRWLADRLGTADAVVPRVAGTLQPLCAIWRAIVVADAERLLARGGAGPRDLATAVRTRVVDDAELRTFDPALRCLCDLDTPADYAAARAAVAPTR